MNCHAADHSACVSRWVARAVGPALVALGCLHLRADVDVGLSGQVVSNSSGPRFSLFWNGVTAATYGVQVSSNLVGPAVWSAVDLTRPTNSAVRWVSPEALADGRYFRLAAPQPEIFSVEPAVFPPGTNLNLYVLGQFFATGDVVRMDGASLGAATFLDHTTLQFALPPTSAGTHTVEVFRAGGMLSSFVVVCASVTDSPEQVLQEPPELPVAAPMAGWLSKKGYDYYQAQSSLLAAWLSKRGYDYYMARSDLSSAGAHTNPYFKESDTSGTMPDIPSRMKAKEKANRTKCGNNLRVTPSGQMEVQAVDLAIPGRGLDFVWARTYLSRTGPTNSTMGTRWTHSYDVWCITNASEATVADGMGRKDIFRKQADGKFTSPGLFREGVATNTGFRMTFADTGYWEFAPPPGGSTAGKLVCTANLI